MSLWWESPGQKAIVFQCSIGSSHQGGTMLSVSSRGLGRLFFLFLTTAYLCLTVLPVSAGQIYKWRDEQGRLHFSDTPRDEETEVVKETKYPVPVSPRTVDPPGKQKSEPSSPEVIRIPYIAKEGHSSRVIIKVKFNGWVTARMLVDTGAPGLIIGMDLADRLNLFDKEGSQLLTYIGGIGGSQSAMRTIINKVSIGNVINEEVIPAHIVPDMSNAYDGLIGMDILSGYSITIDPETEHLIAKEIPKSPKRPGGHYKSWWKGKFREFRAYREYWNYHAELVELKSGTAYSRMFPEKRERYRNFIYHQRDEADTLYRKFEYKANNYFVPKHWRE